MKVEGAKIRSKEVDGLVSAVSRAGVKVFVLSGPAGSGKSWVAHRALSLAAGQGALVGAGKYGETEGHSALSPVMAALSCLVEGALDRFFVIQTGIASLTQSLGVDLDILIGAGLTAPGLTASNKLDAPSDRRGEAKRLAAATTRLLGWLDGFGAPKVILIDDWRRASAEGRALIRALSGLSVGEPLTLILTQRETGRDFDLDGRSDIQVNQLAELDDEDVTELLMSHLGNSEKARLVAAYFGDAVPRLPFHLIQAADALDHCGAFAPRGEGWVLERGAASRLEFDALTRIKRLDVADARLVTALALWGDTAPLPDFYQALGFRADDPVLSAIVKRLQRAAVIDTSASRIAIRHDLLRRAALDVEPESVLKQLSADMAERLPHEDDLSEVEIAALHLRCFAGLDIADPSAWCERLAHGARAARRRSDIAAAATFAEAAFALRAKSQSLARDVERQVLREAVMAAADRDSPDTLVRAEALIASAWSMVEICEDYHLAVTALRFAGQYESAWRLACEGMRRIGITPPTGNIMVSLGLSALRWLSQGRDQKSSRRIPDADRLDTFTAFAATAATIAYHRDPRSAAIIGFEAAALASRDSLRSAYWRGVDAFLFAILGQRKRAARAGERALESFPQQRVMRAMTLYQAVFFGVHWGRSLKSQRPHFIEVTRLAYAESDLLTAAYGLRIHIMSGWRTTDSLDRLLEEARVAHRALLELGEASFSDEMASMVLMLEGLTGHTDWDPGVWRTDLPTRNHVIDLELSNLAGDFHETLRRVRLQRPLRQSYSLQVDSVVMRFHEMLARSRCGLNVKRSDVAFLRQAAKLNPVDHRPKLLLIEAERMRLKRVDPQNLMERYATSIAAATKADSRLDAAMAAACAANAAEEVGDLRLGAQYKTLTGKILRGWGMRADYAAPAGDFADANARAVSAERSDHAKSQLLVHVAHELRTPLQALQTLLDVAAPDGRNVDLNEIRAVLASLAGVVDDLNISNELGVNAGPEREQCVDIEEVVRSEMSVWHAQAELTLRHSKHTPLIDVPANRIRQILRNLLSNAVKYGGGTRIEVSISTEDMGSTFSTVIIQVRDHGDGIPTDNPDLIFEPYQRGLRAGDGAGAGLGLTLSRRIAERLGGTLVGASHPGGGACFTLTFEARRSEAKSAPGHVKPLSILVVEDTALIRQLLRTVLIGFGHKVTDVSDATSAHTACQLNTFDLMILDMGLPDGSGLSILEAERKGVAEPDICPAILLTASTSGEAEAFSGANPRVSVLRKPASAACLAQHINQLVNAQPQRECLSTANELAEIELAAKVEIIKRTEMLLTNPFLGRIFTHQLAGLAAQFQYPKLAVAIERLSSAIEDKKSPVYILQEIDFELKSVKSSAVDF